MAVSVSGVITLLILILGGPFLYGIAYAYQRLSNKVGDSNKSDKSDKDTNVGSSSSSSSSSNSSSSSSGELSIKSGNGVVESAKPTNEDQHEKQETRETYKSSEYIFALVGYAIGIGTFAYFSNAKC